VSTEQAGLAATSVVLVALGLFFILYLGLGTLRRLRAWEARAVRTMATVVRHEVRTYKGNTYYSPVVRFAAPGGADIEFEAERARRSPDPMVGLPLEILYDPEDPSVARLPGQDRAGAWFVFAVGTIFLTVGIVMAAAVFLR
jgi:hypothetical protein